jgi:hypothetical protein
MLRPAVVDSLKALDPNRPIREADFSMRSTNVRFDRQSGPPQSALNVKRT